jgi:hypothetical protein
VVCSENAGYIGSGGLKFSAHPSTLKHKDIQKHSQNLHKISRKHDFGLFEPFWHLGEEIFHIWKVPDGQFETHLLNSEHKSI